VTTSRSRLNISLTPELVTLIEEWVRSGRSRSAREAVREALRVLGRAERERQLAIGTLGENRRGALAAERGDLVAGERVFAGLRRRSAR